MKRVLFILALLWSVAQAQTVTPSAGPYTTQNAKYVWTWGKYTGGVWIPGKLIVEDSARFYGLTYVPLAPDGDSTDKAASTKWIKNNISPGSPGQPTSAWNTTGNYFGTLPVEPLLGFKDSAALNIITNGVKRLIVPGAGIEKSTDAAHRVLLLDTATHKVYFGDPGTGGGGSGISKVIAGYGQTQVNDSTTKVDTVVIASHSRLVTAEGNIAGNTAQIIANTVAIQQRIDSIRRQGGSTQVQARVNGTWVNMPFIDSVGTGGTIDTTSGNPTSLVTQYQHVKTRDSLNVLIAANSVGLGAKLDTSAVYLNAGAINWPGTLYTSPTTGTYGGHKITYTPSLATQSAKYVLTNPSTSIGLPSFNLLDSSWLSGMHTQNYYDLRYAITNVPWVISGSNIYYNTGNVGIGNASPSALLHINNPATGNTISNSLIIENPTPATASVTSQYAGAILLRGNAWKTTATAASRSVDWQILGTATQGTTSPNCYFFIRNSINGAAFSNLLTLSQAGALTISGPISSGNITVGGQVSTTGLISNTQNISGGVATTYNNFNYTGNITNGSPTNFITVNNYLASPNIGNTGAGGTTVRGFFYNPSNTGLTSTTSIGFQNTSGDNLFGTTSGSTVVGGTTVTANRIFDVQGTTVASSPYPKMTTTQRLALSPTESDGVYDMTLHKLYIYDGTIWQAVF